MTGLSTIQITRRTGESKTRVRRWQDRFMQEGVDGLQSAAIAAREYLARVRSQRLVIGALVIRETRTRLADSKLG
jgi:transposase